MSSSFIRPVPRWELDERRFDTPTGARTTVRYVPHYPDRPPFVLQRGIAWHYTSQSVLRSILLKQELWATDWRATNDRSELQHGLSFLQRAWDNLVEAGDASQGARSSLSELGPLSAFVERFDHIHMLCAARERDSPFQWNSYASGEAGIAIGLDMSVPLITDIDDRPRKEGGRLFGAPWLKVLYTQRQKELAAARFVEEVSSQLRDPASFLDPLNFVCLNLLSALNLKHAGFSGEKETRCVSLSSDVDLLSMPSNQAKTIVPWISMPDSNFNEDVPLPPVDKRKYLPIVKVLLTPRTTPPIEQAVRDDLTAAGLSAVPVVHSALPFR